VFIRNCWYVVAWRDEVKDDRLLERTVLGESLLVYLTQAGEPVVLDNRCAHRHAPLSLGRRVGDNVRCMYHGLVFDPTGRCIEVPGQDRIAEGMRTRRYPAVLRGTWIWVWMGEPEKADPALIPDAFSLDHPEWRYKPGGYLHYEVDYLAIADNLLDFSHLSYVHEKTLGGSAAIAEARAKVEKIPRGLRLTRDVFDTTPPPYHAKIGGLTGRVDRTFVYDFVLPSVLLLYAHSKPVEAAADDLSGALRFHSCQALTPETEGSTHYFFMMAHAFRLDDAAVSEAIYQSLLAAFDEDKQIITAQQRLIERSKPQSMQPIPADAALGQFRFMVKQAVDQEA
jgi:phenylpropionate dioxygenase-like ring-hydroxylating dioxygenase large terminal subunit